MRQRHLIWIVPLLLTLLTGLGIAAEFYLAPLWGKRIGGSWRTVRITSPFHGPGTTYQLYRKDGWGLIRVEEYVTRHRFYAPDCVVFQTIQAEYGGVVFAVCGVRTPVAFMENVAWDWDYTDDGLLLPKGRTLAGSTIVMETTLLKPIDRIVALALEQPPYRDNWRTQAGLGLGDADRLVATVERDDLPR